MGDTSSKPAEPAKRGEAAWRAQRDAIASRNERASAQARARRQEDLDQRIARERAAEKLERAQLVNLRHHAS